ncbi:hypothetical protein BY458DRAFT_557987 [Sporodiniella umbellata]|nr:hypothetical protein BY458DRAFT_557987 [Sporodiniella umbellata]
MSDNLAINTRNYKKWSPLPALDIQEEDLPEEEEDEASDLSNSPTIPDENIDFSLVYTLHTFEATVEGQASVKKGDSLCLLDDSNSYWWLIKDLKTAEVGYIPAENIETPYERLARLNKYRNSQIPEQPNAPTIRKLAHKKKVAVSKSIQFQLEIIITSTGEDVQEIVYETWTSEISGDDNNSGEKVGGEIDIDDTSSQRTLTDEEGLPTHILRVHAGNLNVGAYYHSIRVTENINTDDLLSKTLDKFHIPQIDIHHHKHSIEYYLAIRNREGEEITLRTEDKPYSIYKTLNSYLTTPMPRLSEQFKNSLKPKKKQEIQFLLHKRIKRKGDGGIVHVKLSLLTQTSDNSYSLHSWLTKKRKKSTVEPERIDKMVAVDGALTVSQLTNVALEKFHIIPHESQKYRLLLHTRIRDVLLNNNLILSNILKGLNHDEEKQFILHSSSSAPVALHDQRKVFPEMSQPMQVSVAVDRATQAILKKVDSVLSRYSPQKSALEGKFTMSVSRNGQGGIDIHLPHGLIKSVQIEQKVQYLLLPCKDNLPLSQDSNFIQKENGYDVPIKELEMLVQYGSHYLDTLESRYRPA